MIISWRLVFSAACLLALFCGKSAHAQDFRPTEAEWASWPGYCQAKYVWTPTGEGSIFLNRVGATQRQELAMWEKTGIVGVHHYCFGKVWLERAQAVSLGARSEYPVEFMLRQAWQETAYTALRSDRASPFFTDIVLVQATIRLEQKDLPQAKQLIMQRIGERPKDDILYSAAAVILRKSGNLAEARDILQKGLKATEGQSAEINYNLGLISLELGDIEAASGYADAAYRLGYPLLGLRRKLDRLRASRQ
jgi:tetratricopeptide (TPR) repeat protein